jgi:hypothetical protein
MLTIVLLVASLTLIVVTPVVSLAIFRTARKLKKEGENDRS